MDSIGDLVDKLSVVNIKMYHLVDIIQGDFGDHEVAAAARKAQALNRTRSTLINEINERFGQTEMIVKL